VKFRKAETSKLWCDLTDNRGCHSVYKDSEKFWLKEFQMKSSVGESTQRDWLCMVRRQNIVLPQKLRLTTES